MFFETPDLWRQWLANNHAGTSELWVDFHTTKSGKACITWPESVDQALCFGWIDGRRERTGPDTYRIRFTPRRPRSMWSNRNIERVAALAEQGLMQPAGLAAFDAGKAERSGVYSHEQPGHQQLDDHEEAQFRANPSAWDFFAKKSPSYRKAALWWVVSAKKEDTRKRRLEALIDYSAQGQTVPHLTRR